MKYTNLSNLLNIIVALTLILLKKGVCTIMRAFSFQKKVDHLLAHFYLQGSWKTSC